MQSTQGARWKKSPENNPENSGIPELSDKNLKIFVAFVFASLLIVSGLMIYNKLQQTPEKFTEFYLKNSAKKLIVGQQEKIEFVVVNHQGEKTNYEYKISFGSQEKSQRISLDNNENREFSENVEFSSPGQEKVSLHLINIDNNKVLELWQWFEVEEK
ncbi:MAG: DUF1616 domain-containing protein [Candidatus Diapherotrites archaeon]|nr:DUF1616 domain-containing protein [Candidatus Diapherotrites archaeon]